LGTDKSRCGVKRGAKKLKEGLRGGEFREDEAPSNRSQSSIIGPYGKLKWEEQKKIS